MKQRLTQKLATVVVAASLSLAALTGCTSGNPTPTPSSEPAAKSDKVLLAVSFGTSYNDNRDLSIGGIEKALTEAYPDYEVRRAFTAQTIIDILEERDNIQIDNVQEAMQRLVADGVKEVVVQPTTILNGYEYGDVIKEVAPYEDIFESFTIGEPLLTSDQDFADVAKAVTDATKQYVDDETAIVYMGHGTEAPSNSVYTKMQDVLTEGGFTNYFVGTVEAEPSLEDMLEAVKAGNFKKVVLIPFMIVAGDHANNDMAGDEEDSWKTAFTEAGFEVQTVLEGMGQNPAIQQIFVQHAKAAMDKPAPIKISQVKDGTYAIDATTDAGMFKVVDTQLTVANGEATAKVTLSGSGFGQLYLGKADAAATATTGLIAFTNDAEGRHVYEVPVSALNKTLDVAAESGKTPGKWYDHTITFESARIPADAISE